MHEFGLDEEHHIRLTESPSKLLLMTIGILGDLCREELSLEKNVEVYEQRKSELRNVAKYFDALIGSKLQTDYEYYLCLLGAASYYLADMPGSASVLSKRLEHSRTQLTQSGIEFLLEYIIRLHEPLQVGIFPRDDIRYKQNPEQIPLPDLDIFMSVFSKLGHFFDMQGNDDFSEADEKVRFLSLTNKLQEYFFENGSDRELLLAQISAATIQKRLKNSTKILLPIYTGLNWDVWGDASRKPTFIKELWPAQRLLGDAGVFNGKSAVIQLPTSAGKTKSAELIIRSSFLSGRATVAVIIAPFRSLCREISSSLSLAFAGEEVLVNQLNDVPQIDDFDVELFSQLFGKAKEMLSETPTIVVATPEKLVYLLRHKPELAGAISLVIYDEGHQFDTGARGVTYELLLTSLKRELREQTQHVLISAVLSNAKSIGDWLYAGDGTLVNGAECLSTDRSIAFSSWTRGLGQFHYVDPFNINTEEFFVPRVMESIELPKKSREKTKKYFPPKNDKSLIAGYLGVKLSALGPVAVFCGQKNSVTKICRDVASSLERINKLDSPLTYSDGEEIRKIAYLSEMHFGNGSDITKAINFGILPHSANIPNGLRISVEHAMESGLGRCVVCTSTLAQGVNLPIKYLIISGVFQGEKPISARDFHNLLGRAGRAGKHTEGSIIFADTELFDKRSSTKSWQWSQMSTLLDPSKAEGCLSSLLILVQPFKNAPFNIDSIKYLQSPRKYEKLSREAAENKAIDISSLLGQMKQRDCYVKSLESYLLANLPNDEMLEGEELIDLCNGTFAFQLATEEEKKKLEQLFGIVANRVKQVEPAKRQYFGKALLGIQELEFLENWIKENIELLGLEADILYTLEALWPLIESLGTDNGLGKLIGENAGLTVAKQWCSGVSYYDILSQSTDAGFKFRAGSQRRILKIENIIDICDSGLGYDAMLIIGACADLLENLFGNPPITESVRKLQASLRIGLSDSLATELHAIGLADRVVALKVAENLNSSGNAFKEFGRKLVMTHRQAIEQSLSNYPSVFYNALYRGV
nr:DEAD/DEAH box helicase [Aliivibrio fischeri]